MINGALPNVAFEAIAARQALPLSPGSFQLTGRTYGSPLVGCDHAQKTLDAHDAHIGNATDRRLIHGNELRTDGRRTDRAAVQHVWHSVVLHVLALSRALGWNVRPQQRLADDGVGRRIFQRRLRVNLKVKALAANQSGNADARSARGRANHARRDGELIGWTLQ